MIKYLLIKSKSLPNIYVIIYHQSLTFHILIIAHTISKETQVLISFQIELGFTSHTQKHTHTSIRRLDQITLKFAQPLYEYIKPKTNFT